MKGFPIETLRQRRTSTPSVYKYTKGVQVGNDDVSLTSETIMEFPNLPYMNWAKTQFPAPGSDELDLATSNMPPAADFYSSLGIDTSKLPISGPNSYGYAPVREAIARRYGVKPEEVMHTHGTSMANYLLFMNLLDKGDKVAAELPIYDCLLGPLQIMQSNIIELKRTVENNWKFPFDAAIDAAKNGVRVIFLSNAHNPSGDFICDDDIISLADEVGDNCKIVIDEVYREWVEGNKAKSAALKRPNIYVTSSLTKVFGLGGLRAGWMIAPEDFITKCYRSYDTMAVVHPFATDWIMGQIFNHPSLLEDMRDATMHHLMIARRVVDAFLDSDAGQMVKCVMPENGGFAFWRIEGMNGDEVCQALREDKKMVMVPGRFFMEPDYFRISWTGGAERIGDGLLRMQGWLQNRQ